MDDYELEVLPDGSQRYSTPLRGIDVLDNQNLNKGSAFPLAEREALGLTGLLGPAVVPLPAQVARHREQLASMEPLAKYEHLSALQLVNLTLYYAVLNDDLEGLMPIVYTPTVGLACERFGHVVRRACGLYIPITYRDRIRDILRNWPEKHVRFSVVTDGSRVLGLGDLGANGMGIPVGKLSLYTAVAGVPPRLTLPITLDVGTDNVVLRNDPTYPGLNQARVTGPEYDSFIDEFVAAFTDVFPGACIQWEDFNVKHAEPILTRFMNKVCTFNDDIQGTAATAVAGLYAAARAKKQTMADQRILILGAGSAGVGIAELFSLAVQAEGYSEADAQSRIRLFDVDGLITTSRSNLEPFQMRFAVDSPEQTSFVEEIREFAPTGIIGVSTVGGAFDASVLSAMCEVQERPIIFPYSNPTSHSETTAEAAYTASNGSALFASGSPFPEVKVNGRFVMPSQGNNVYIFPAIGLALLATRARRVTEHMFLIAAQTLADQVSEAELADGLLYPARSRIAESANALATALATYIFDQGHARVERPDDIEAFVESHRYSPSYLPVVPS